MKLHQAHCRLLLVLLSLPAIGCDEEKVKIVAVAPTGSATSPRPTTTRRVGTEPFAEIPLVLPPDPLIRVTVGLPDERTRLPVAAP